MRKQKGFTLIELLVVISIIALLMAILMPSLQRVRKQAKTVACRSNVKQWGLIWAMYTDENQSKFPDYLGYLWMMRLVEYYSDSKIRNTTLTAKNSSNSKKLLYCPMTTKTIREGAPVRYSIISDASKHLGSYALNQWIYYSDVTSSGLELDEYWRNTNHRGLNNIPLMADGAWRPDGQPCETDTPPTYDGERQTRIGPAGDEMRIFCINRHDGFINALFMDWTVRKVGLKELWTLKWHRDYETAGPWTKAGGVQAEDWPQWMRRFKDY